MTNEQKEKIIELRKLGTGYRRIDTTMDISRDSVRSFCKSQGLDGYGQDYIKPKPEKVIRENCKNCRKQTNQKRLKERPKTYFSTEDKRDWKHKNPIIYKLYTITAAHGLRINQRVPITVVADATFEIGSVNKKITIIRPVVLMDSTGIKIIFRTTSRFLASGFLLCMKIQYVYLLRKNLL